MNTDDEYHVLPPHERPFEAEIARRAGYEHVAYKTLDEARSDKNAIVIFTGDYGGQVYLTCPVNKVKCGADSLRRLLSELGKFAWGDGEDVYFERARPDGFVTGGMGGGHVEEGLWIHREFRNLLETGVDILPDVTDVIENRAASVLPGVVARLVSYLESLDTSKAKPGQINFGNVGDIADALTNIGFPAVAALPTLKRLESTGIFARGGWWSYNLADRITEIEEQSGDDSQS